MEKKNKFNYKNIVINKEELAITKIGEMSNENKSPAFLFIVFGILILFVFFLPNIVSYFNKDDELINDKPISNNNENKKENEKHEDLVYYDLNNNLVVDLEEGIKLQDFKIDNNHLSFLILNSNNISFDFKERNYFLEIYTEDKTLLKRIILKKEIISKGESKSFSYDINDMVNRSEKKITFVKKSIDDYPSITLNKNEAEEEVLVCQKDMESITYKFNNEKLETIMNVINYDKSNKSDFTYQNDYSLWQTRINSYNKVSGVSSSFISNNNGFIVNTIIDLKNTKLSELDNENYYKYETLGKVINFEMEARGFDCN